MLKIRQENIGASIYIKNIERLLNYWVLQIKVALSCLQWLLQYPFLYNYILKSSFLADTQETMYSIDLDFLNDDQYSSCNQFSINLESKFPFANHIDPKPDNQQIKVKKQPIINLFYQESYIQELNQPPQLNYPLIDKKIEEKSGQDCKQNSIVKTKNGKKIIKSKKNQYDKNIFANITSVVIKKMLSSSSISKIKFYCLQKQLSYETFRSYFLQIQRKKIRLGTTQMLKFYSNSSIPNSLKQVFSMFLITFLKEQYILYIIRQGKMSNKQKYLQCAIKMMYIPQLKQLDYQIINAQANESCTD